MNPTEAGSPSCNTSNICLIQISNCRMSDRSIEIYGNQVAAVSKVSYTVRETTACHKKYNSTSYTGTYSHQNNSKEFSTMDLIRIPDTISEVPEKNKKELRKMENCNQYREDLITTYPRCN